MLMEPLRERQRVDGKHTDTGVWLRRLRPAINRRKAG